MKIPLLTIILLFLINCTDKTVELKTVPNNFIGSYIPVKLKTLDDNEPDIFVQVFSQKIEIVRDYKFQKVSEENIIKKIEKISDNRLRINCIKDNALKTELNIIKNGNDFKISEFIKSGHSDADGEYGTTERYGHFNQL